MNKGKTLGIEINSANRVLTMVILVFIYHFRLKAFTVRTTRLLRPEFKIS